MPVGIPEFEMNGYDYNSARSYHYPTYENPYVRDLETYRRDDPFRSEDRFEQRRDDFYSIYGRQEDYKTYDSRPAGGGRGGNECSSFEVDHLATFSATQSDALRPDVGLSKLAMMANTSGIWTMKCNLIIERNYLVIYEKGTGNEVERFPLVALRNPVAISKPDKREVYNNLVLLTVAENNDRHEAHMHIFLAGSVPAQEIVNEIISAKDGRPATHINSRIPPPPSQPAPEPPNYVRDKAYSFERNLREPEVSYDPKGFPAMAIRDQDMESVLSDKTEKDVQLLNHCFDDIEKFVSRLQKAAESYKELERLKKDKAHKGKKNRQEVEDRLMMKAQPPQNQDYVDIFQKFKMSFNLLAKLKTHIHDPNAPELVHFLFTPLSLIYEASRDSSHGHGDLAAHVVSPLLTKEAKDLLMNCLTSKETELWNSLGKAWSTSSEYWPHPVQPYTPRFYNGWHPNLDDIPGAPPNIGNGPYINHPMPAPIRYEEPQYFHEPPRREEVPRREELLRREEPPPMRKPIAMPPEDHPDNYPDDLGIPVVKKYCKVYNSRTKKNNKELTVVKGEILEVLEDSRNWWKLKNAKGEIGHAPFTILRKIDKTEADNGVANRNGQRGDSPYF